MECWDVEDIWKNEESGLSPIYSYTILYIFLFLWSLLEVIHSIYIERNWGNIIIATFTTLIAAVLIGMLFVFNLYINNWQGIKESNTLNSFISPTQQLPVTIKKVYRGPYVMPYKDFLREGWCKSNLSIGSMNHHQREISEQEYARYVDKILLDAYSAVPQ